MDKPTSVAGIVFNSKRDQVLLIKRRDVPVWVLPGGGLEKKETPEHGALREAEEETGLKLKLKRKVGLYLPKNSLTKATYLFEFTPVGGTLKKGSETLDIQYFPVKKLPRIMPPPYFEWIEDSLNEFSASFVKKTSSVTYLVLAWKLLQHPYLVLRHILIRLKIFKHRNYMN